jgi:hypothetical protein
MGAGDIGAYKPFQSGAEPFQSGQNHFNHIHFNPDLNTVRSRYVSVRTRSLSKTKISSGTMLVRTRNQGSPITSISIRTRVSKVSTQDQTHFSRELLQSGPDPLQSGQQPVYGQGQNHVSHRTVTSSVKTRQDPFQSGQSGPDPFQSGQELQYSEGQTHFSQDKNH